jgi:hypothetical protein
MTDAGGNVLLAVRQIRDLFEEISRLISTANSLMEEQGWNSAIDYSKAISVSNALAQPRSWLPYEIFGLYRSPDLPHIFAFITVILDHRREQERLAEPLLSAGWFDYGEGNKARTNPPYSFAGWHLEVPDRKNDGTKVATNLQTAPRRIRGQMEKHRIDTVTTFALPLVAIGDSNALKEKVIGPLLSSFDSLGHPSLP